ncbi:TetR/AcrR family transcriptional regulator [Pengzhenrongella sicca]|uniref:TetR/AcrR family transcriptional regulator C-terminal domain-containing protein n=1 Tax=Pengzhenrongella sicca TaxID=2819238 RepID=A0A8A4ZDG0_9MICO|nr:TetR/AcrR family transcriptional regulator [Pengzhenrongella sicca]QTE28517.1 TetR/AcrR family transcriptional regulator C-terminal domain-containing protein [Pengzhenrongella sicca]
MGPEEIAATLRLLWRHERPGAERAKPGPSQRLDVDEVVSAAIDVADRRGLAGVSMRALAAGLGISAMSVYTYVTSRDQLVALMVDETLGRIVLPPHELDVRARLEAVAGVVYGVHRRHPWLAEASGRRPGLGPHAWALYEWQLEAVQPLGVGDVELDQAVTLITGFAVNAAVLASTSGDASQDDLDWWATVAPVLGELTDAADYPLAHRVGTAAGEAYAAARDTGREYDFGLRAIAQGLIGLSHG